MANLYEHLSKIQDPHLKRTLKLILDKIGDIDTRSTDIGLVTKPLSAALDASNNHIQNLKNPVNRQDAATKQYVDLAISGATKIVQSPAPPVVLGTGTGGGTQPPPGALPCVTNIANGQPGGVPAAPNLRWWRGDFCGVSVPGLPAVPNGATSPDVVFSPYIDRYGASDQAKIFAAHHARGYTHFSLSWPDSRDNNGQSVAQFVATCQMVQANGFYPAVFLFSKDFDGYNPAPSKNDAVISALQAVSAAPIYSVGWELNLFNDPGPTIQALIDHVAAQVVPASNLYVHFSEGIVAWQSNGQLGPAFWNPNQGKLTGLLHQKRLDASEDCGLYQAHLNDLQVRFGGGVGGWPTDSGLGHPFDTVAWEYSASFRFNGTMTEGSAQLIGQQAISAVGPVPIMGFGNGGPNV